MDITLHATEWITITGRGTIAIITTPHETPWDLKGHTVTIDGKHYRVRGVEHSHPRKPDSPYGLLVTEVTDTSPHPPSNSNPHTTTAQNTETTASPATNDHAAPPHAPHARY